ncbi:MAG TPA: hypothetical protein VII06_09905 [Chloroflexota bacterium]|jgi:hypothetical protein
MDAEQIARLAESIRVNPYTVPRDQQGWRGLSVPENAKRKWYTVLHNDQVLVTALLLIPGERSIRHSHESGELSIHFLGELRPQVTWNPPGVLHGPPPRPSIGPEVADLLGRGAPSDASSPEIAAVVQQLAQLQVQMQEMQAKLLELTRPEPSPRVIVDILFPPFKTTIDDPAYPEKKTIQGQWYD